MRRIGVLVLVALFTVASSLHRVQASAGELDTTFGAGGKVTTDFFSLYNQASDIAIQPDGRIIAAGYTETFTSGEDFAVARYNPDGSLDTTFAAGGTAMTDFFGTSNVGSAVALQTDGRVVVAGYTINAARFTDFAFARYNSDGSLDSSFGVGGKVTVSFPSLFSQAADLALQSDGKLVAAGFVFGTGDFSFAFALARLNQDGSLDSSFGSGGRVITSFFVSTDEFTADDQARAVAIQPDGKIIAAGRTHPPGGALDFGVARYNANGTLDGTFGSGGKVATDFLGFGEEARGVAIQQDGRIVAAGVGGPDASGGDFVLARYDVNGSLDPAFGGGGKVTTDFSMDLDGANALLIQPDNKIVAAGTASANRTQDSFFALTRYNSDGSLDPGFGEAGKVTTALSIFDSAWAAALQPDGKIIAAGVATTNETNSDFALLRYEGDSSFDICLRDDNSSSLLQIDSATGNYQFSNCDGLTLSGTGTLSNRGCNIILQHTASDRRIMATINTCSNRGTASIQSLSQGARFNITDRNTANNTCGCR